RPRRLRRKPSAQPWSARLRGTSGTALSKITKRILSGAPPPLSGLSLRLYGSTPDRILFVRRQRGSGCRVAAVGPDSMLTASTRLGPYEIVGPLGAGGMGEVYRARDVRLGRAVAVKVLPEAFANDPERLARFEREARAVAALSHPNILAIHDYGTHGAVT